MLLVISIGTILVAFDLYALSILDIPMMNAISLGLSFLLLPIIVFTAINDGILGVLAYILSTIGLFKSMKYGLGIYLEEGLNMFCSFFIFYYL